MFSIHMFPAGHGDCLWIEYGDPAAPHRVLIDGGVKETFADQLKPRIADLAPEDRHFELFVLTHIDADHIEGAIELIQDRSLSVSYGDVWFNGWHHLPADQLSPRQGMEFSAAIRERDLPWNAAFDGNAVMVDEQQPTMPERTLPGGLKLTLLSPTTKMLIRLKRVWDAELRRSGLLEDWEREFLGTEEEGDPTESMDIDALAESRFKADGSKPNGSSIALLAEWEGRRVLLAGDAYAPVLRESVRLLARQRGEDRLALDAFKLPHHGSAKNLDNRLLAALTCPDYLISTNGDRFHHPDHKAIARILKHGGANPCLRFNCRSDENAVWEDEGLRRTHGYRVDYPDGPDAGLTVHLN